MSPTRRAFVLQLAATLGAQPARADSWSSDPPADEADDETDEDTAPDLIDIALSQRGKPYLWGSAAGRSYFGPDPTAFDCSGFVAWTFRSVGVYVPASTSSAWRATLPTDDPQPGDLGFWNMQYASPRVQHVAINLGEGLVIQAGGRRPNVNVDSASAIGTPSFRRLGP
jgi:cell wall-associated NlpC family hydrolase